VPLINFAVIITLLFEIINKSTLKHRIFGVAICSLKIKEIYFLNFARKNHRLSIEYSF